jgi:hypothetical protein
LLLKTHVGQLRRWQGVFLGATLGLPRGSISMKKPAG